MTDHDKERYRFHNPPLTSTQWLICFVAALGFAFDTYELLMLPLIVRPALMDLLDVPANSPLINQWVGILFYVPAIAGGIFGLIGGYLTDLFGRRRVLVWSILIYAFSALAAGFATSVEMLLFWRCTTFIGVCVEFVAAVAWLSEIFHVGAERREKVVGYTQAFGSFGGLMVTGAYYLAVTYGPSLPEIRGGHEAWRYTLISGVIPAIPLIIIRPFLPESPIWNEKRVAGTLRRPSFAELFTPALRRTTIVTTIMMACAYGAAFGAIQQVPRIVPGLAEVSSLPRPQIEQTVSRVQLYQEIGGLTGRLLLAFLATYIVSRRGLLRTFQVPGLVMMPIVLLWGTSSLTTLQWGVFVIGLLTIAQFSFWGNYLPRVYPTHLRGTGESFAANVGGRLIGTFGAYLTVTLVPSMPGGTPPMQLAYAAALVGTSVYVIGLAASIFLPEPREGTIRD